MSILTQALYRFGQKAAGICLPNSCLLCGTDSDHLVCADCACDLPFLPAACCPQCAEPTLQGELCGHCLSNSPYFDSTVALYRYAFPVDRLVHSLKYGHQLAVAAWFGRRLAAALNDRGFGLILAMPLHPDRLRSRGFNQSQEIARTVCRRLGIPGGHGILQRRRATSPQADLPFKDRADNVRGAFECLTDVSGHHILVVDDVMTSGATMNECARVLKIHGAAKVTAAVVARALRHD